MSANEPKVLTEKGAAIVKAGGADGVSDDAMLVLELAKRCPGASADDLAAFFIALRMQCGENALYAIQNGHVEFERRKPQ